MGVQVSLEQLFLQLGICGAMLLVWFRIETQRGERQSKTEDARISTENKRIEAMEEGFRSLASMIADHAQSDTESHAKQTERLASIETTLGLRVKTPARGVSTEIVRRTDGR
jgi:hypothetical protein